MLFKSVTAKLCWKCKKCIRITWMTVALKCFTLFQFSKICIYTILFISEKSGLSGNNCSYDDNDKWILFMKCLLFARHHTKLIIYLLLDNFYKNSVRFQILTFINRLRATKWLTEITLSGGAGVLTRLVHSEASPLSAAASCTSKVEGNKAVTELEGDEGRVTFLEGRWFEVLNDLNGASLLSSFRCFHSYYLSSSNFQL